MASSIAAGDWNFSTHTVATAARTREVKTPAEHLFKAEDSKSQGTNYMKMLINELPPSFET